MSPRKTFFAAVAAAVTGLLLATSSVASPAVGCSTHGLQAVGGKNGVSVTRISANGIGCDRAISIARTVAGQVAHGKALTVPGSTALTMSESVTCTGCPMSTQIALTYPAGGLEITLKGGSETSSEPGTQTIPVPKLPAIPGFTWPKIPGFTLPRGFPKDFPNIPGFPKIPGVTVPGNPSTNSNSTVTV
jgi:hypothetical protein